MFEIGNSLREARERQGLGYPEIELATKIRAKYIRALEEEDFTSIPGDAYIRGFLRTYAEYLGLDGDVYVDEYASRFITSWRDELPPRPERRRIRPRERRLERRAVLLVLAGIVLVAVLVFAAWQNPRLLHARAGTGEEAAPPLGGHQPARLARRRRRDLRRGAPQQGLRQGRPTGNGGSGTDDRLPGSRFYLLVRTPAGLRVTLDGRAVALPAVHNLRVLVTPKRTTRLRG